jgi:hypothetical protein
MMRGPHPGALPYTLRNTFVKMYFHMNKGLCLPVGNKSSHIQNWFAGAIQPLDAVFS